MSDRVLGWLTVVALLVTAVGVLGVDYVVDEPSAPAPRVVRSGGDAVGGSWVCGVGTTGSGRQVTTVVARPGGAGAAPTQVEVDRFVEGERTLRVLPTLAGGSDVRTTVHGSEDELTASWIRWRGRPAAAWREWHLEDDEDLPDATIAGPCAAPSSPGWVVPGLSTLGGDEARLRLSNPFRSAATLAVGFLTPDGEVRPLALENLTVPAGAVREIVIDEVLPEEADLSALVEVVSGRLSVEGLQIARAEIGDVDGGSLLAAAPAPAEAWTIPWVTDAEDASSWLWVANPSERPAAVELILHTADGGVVPAGLAEAGVPPGSLRRVDLTGTLPEDVEVVGLTARSNGVPVVVSAATRLTSDDVARTGTAVQLGVSTPDDTWIVAGTAAQERAEELHVVNPTAAPAIVDVTVFDGTELNQPSSLQNVEVPAGSHRILSLSEDVEGVAWTAFVTAADGEVVVGRVGRTLDEDTSVRLVAVPGQPSSAWAAHGSGLAGDVTEGLVRQLRTSLGVGERP